MIRFEVVSLGSGGGVRCCRCHGPVPRAVYRDIDEISAEIAAAIEGWADAPGPNVTLAGPEPFGHPALPAIVAAAVRAGVRRLRLDTDGAALRSADNAAGSLSAGVRHLGLTLLGGTPGLHDALAGAPGAFDAMSEGARTFRAASAGESADVNVVALLPVCRHNVRDLPATVGAAMDVGADRVIVSVEDGGIDLGPALPWLTAACDTGVVNGSWVEVEGVPFCLMPEHALHVADTLRARRGAKAIACSTCALDDVCGGAMADAGPDVLGLLHAPAAAERLWAGVSRARGAARADG